LRHEVPSQISSQVSSQVSKSQVASREDVHRTSGERDLDKRLASPPAAIAGLNVAQLVELSRTMIRSCGPDVPPAENPAVALGIALGAAAARGRDKVTMLASPALAS
jgi:hypothetical protein